MTLLGGIVRRSVEDATVPLTDASLVEWINGGKSLAGVAVNEKRAYGLTAYLRAISLIAGTNAALPLKVYRNGSRERLTQPTVLDNPNPAQTPFEYWQTTYAHALGWGNAYSRKIRNGADVVTQVWPIHPSRVRVESVEITERNPEGKLFLVNGKHGVERLTAWEIMQLPYLSLDGLSGLSPLQAARTALGVAVAAEDTAARLYGNGTRLSGVLQSKKGLTETQADRLKSQWRRKVSGPENAGDIAVLDNDTEFKATVISPADAQLLESRKFSVTEIARLFGIPPHMLGDVEKSTSWGTGIESQTTGFVVFTDRPWLTMVEQRVTRELLPGGWTAGTQFAEYSLEGLLRGDSKTRAEFYRVLIEHGIMSPNEARALENLTPVDGLDIYMFPKNMELVDRTGDSGLSALDMAGLLQKTYLAVDKIITNEEARQFVIDAGLDIAAGPLPQGDPDASSSR